MNEKPAVRPKKRASGETPVHTLNEGAVTAMIWRRQSPSGYAYYDFSLARSWQSLSSGSTAHSRNFFAANQEDLMKVIEQASQWIAERETPVRPALAA